MRTPRVPWGIERSKRQRLIESGLTCISVAPGLSFSKRSPPSPADSMNPNAATAAAAVLVAAIVTLLAIAAKLIVANLNQRSKKSFAVQEVRRKEIASRLKEVQLKRTSARGTLEFWERRRTETKQRVFDMRRDVEAYVEQMGPLEGEEGYTLEDDAMVGRGGRLFYPRL